MSSPDGLALPQKPWRHPPPHPQCGLGKAIGTKVGRELWAPLAALINASLPTEEPLRPRGIETPLWRHPQGEWGGVPSVSGLLFEFR